MYCPFLINASMHTFQLSHLWKASPYITYYIILKHLSRAKSLMGGRDLFPHDEISFKACVVYFFQVRNLTKFLDPSGLGVISFEDFHRGISAISNGGKSTLTCFYCLVNCSLCAVFVDSDGPAV